MYDDNTSSEPVEESNPYHYTWPRAFASLAKVAGLCFIIWVLFGGH